MDLISRLRRTSPEPRSSLPPPPPAPHHRTNTTLTQPSESRRSRLTRFASIAAFVYLSATIVVMASERVYWYWSGFTAESVLFLGGFYLLPTLAGLWALALAPARRVHQVVLAGAIFAYVVEGVLTPIIYADGPLPLMAAMFIGWHGIIAFGGFWYLIRRWLLAGNTTTLALASAIFGAMWGVWAVTSAVADEMDPDELAELGGDGTVLAPDEFTVYAVAVTATLAVAHWLIGFVWPRNWTPTRGSTRAVFIANIAYMALAVLLIVPWAPVKLVVLIGGAWRLLKRRPAPETTKTGTTDDRTVIEQLAGRIKLRHLAPLTLMPTTAAITYAETHNHLDNTDRMSGIYWSLIATQILLGATAYLWAWRQARRLDTTSATRTELGVGTVAA